MPVTAHRVTDRAPARAWTRESPKRMAVALRPSASTDGCAIRSKTGFARTQAWPARSVCSRRALTARARACSSSRLCRRRWQPRSPGAFTLQVLLDPGVLVEGVDGDLGAAGDDLGLELARGVATDPPVEDDLDGVRAAEVEVVGDQGVEEAAGVAGLGERDGAGDLDLGHRQFPPPA